MAHELDSRIALALEARADLMDPQHRGAVRLFNGFYEGDESLAVDLYGCTLVVHHYGEPEHPLPERIGAAVSIYRERLPWLRAGLLKERRGATPEARNGTLLFGELADLDRRIEENGVRYALALTMNRDASLYLDTRLLRAWAKAELAGAKVLNTFAYTGSLGVAARAAPAAQVVQLDLNRTFLNLAKDSYALNGFPVARSDFRVGDFWEQVNRLKREDALFDCVFLDPPFFSATAKGRVELEGEYHRVINKVRPLIADGGRLVAINNALFVSGAEYLRMLEALGADGYLSVESFIAVPPDFTGTAATRVREPPVDPAPFNHPTKIAVLRVRRKDGRKA